VPGKAEKTNKRVQQRVGILAETFNFPLGLFVGDTNVEMPRDPDSVVEG